MHPTIQRLAQNLVVRSNRFRPFLELNRAAYRGAISAFVRACRTLPHLRSIHLRHSLVGGSWVPGLSDIDLTVVLGPGVDPEEEFAVLSEFWRRFRRLQGLLPMLGEVDVLREDQVASWSRYTLRGYELKDWQRVHGSADLESCYRGQPEDILRDARDRSVTAYMHHFLPRVLEDHEPDFIASRQLERLAENVLRRSRSGPADVTLRTASTSPAIRPALLAEVLERLAEILPAHDGRRGDGTTFTVHSDVPGDVQPPRRAGSAGSFWTEVLDGHAACVESIFRVGSDVFILMRRGPSPEALERCLEAVLDAARSSGIQPTIVNVPLLDALCRFYRGPFFYQKLRTAREILLGSDPLEHLKPPQPPDAVRTLLAQTVNVIAAARCREIFDPAPRGSAGLDRLLELTLARALFIRLHLEAGEIRPSYEENLAACRRRYPEYFERLASILRRDESEPSALPSRPHFELLRDLADTVHLAIASASASEP